MTTVAPAASTRGIDPFAHESPGEVVNELTDDRLAASMVGVNSARLIRPRGAPDGAFREFEADIEQGHAAGAVDSVIGTISGRLSWLAWLPELMDEGIAVDRFGQLITAALDIGDRLTSAPGTHIAAVVLVERVTLEPEWTNLLGRRIAEQLIDLLLLTPESTLFLVHLGREANPVGQLPPGVDPDLTIFTPHADDVPADFEQWRATNIWWMRPNNPTRQLPEPSGSFVRLER